MAKREQKSTAMINFYRSIQYLSWDKTGQIAHISSTYIPFASLFGKNENQFGRNENQFGTNEIQFGRYKNQCGTNEMQFGRNKIQFDINETYILFLICYFHILA